MEQTGIIVNSTLAYIPKLAQYGNDSLDSFLSNRQDEEEDKIEQRIVSIIVPILFAIIVIVGLVGNSLVVIVVKCNPQMCSTTNLLIINLAIADLLFIIFCVPFTAWDYAFTYWPFGSIWCKVVQYLIVICAYSSIYTLVLMSLDRYLAVAHPIRSISLRTVDNTNRAILIFWVFIIIFCIPTIITHNVSYASDDRSVCTFLFEEYNVALYRVSFFLFSYIIPIFIIIILYILMLKRLWFGVIPGRNMSSESVRSKKKVTRMVVIVVIIFACCWCPIQIVLILRSFNLYTITPITVTIQITAHILAYMNSCVNPILYAFLSENFRKAFRRVISCNKYSKRTPDQAATDNRLEQELTIGMCQNQTTKALNGNSDI